MESIKSRWTFMLLSMAMCIQVETGQGKELNLTATTCAPGPREELQKQFDECFSATLRFQECGSDIAKGLVGIKEALQSLFKEINNLGVSDGDLVELFAFLKKHRLNRTSSAKLIDNVIKNLGVSDGAFDGLFAFLKKYWNGDSVDLFASLKKHWLNFLKWLKKHWLSRRSSSSKVINNDGDSDELFAFLEKPQKHWLNRRSSSKVINNDGDSVELSAFLKKHGLNRRLLLKIVMEYLGRSFGKPVQITMRCCRAMNEFDDKCWVASLALQNQQLYQVIELYCGAFGPGASDGLPT